MKAKLIKSKSSNTNIKMSKRDKKCRSNADIQDTELKKKIPGNSNEDEDAPKRPKTIRRPGRKRFLPFVLTMLSKSTTGTQFPDAKIKKNKIKTRKRKIYDGDLIGDLGPNDEKLKYKSKTLNDEDVDKEIENLIVLQSKKEIIQTPSNNSQWSSKEPLKLPDFPPLVPKIASDSNNPNTSNVKPINAETVNENHKKLLSYINFANNNCIDNEKENQLALFDLNKDPVTLVSEDTRKDSKLYNFFVDLLETTFNVYNVNAAFDVGAEDNQITSKITWNNETEDKKSKTDIKTAVDDEPQNETNNLNIYGEDWDDKLLDDVETMNLRDLSPEKPLVQYNHPLIKTNRQIIENNIRSVSQYNNRQLIQNNRPLTQNNNLPILKHKKQFTARPSLQDTNLEDLNEDWMNENNDFDTVYRDVSQEPSIIKEKRRIKPKSLITTRKPLQAAKSFDYPATGKYKKHSKSYEKKTFLNLLKEQISAADSKYVEPQNLFEALQVMARYKSKCKKSIRFEDTHTKNEGDDLKACMYKRRQLISTGKKNNINTAPIKKKFPKKPAFAGKKKKSVAKSSHPVIINEYRFGSSHSLEVYNDYTNEIGDLYY